MKALLAEFLIANMFLISETVGDFRFSLRSRFIRVNCTTFALNDLFSSSSDACKINFLRAPMEQIQSNESLPKSSTTLLRRQLVEGLRLILPQKCLVIVLLAMLVAHMLRKVVVQHALLVWLGNGAGDDGEEAQTEQNHLAVIHLCFCVVLFQKILEIKKKENHWRKLSLIKNGF